MTIKGDHPRLGSRFRLDAVLDTFTVGVLILDRKDKVVFCNRAAASMLDDGFSITDDNLSLYDGDEHDVLRTILADLEENASKKDVRGMAVSRPSGKRALSFTIRLLTRNVAEDHSRNVYVLILISDPSRITSLGSAPVSELFGLSASETRLLLALVETGSLITAAQNCKITEGSARQYMKRIFHKTHTRSQVELMTLLAGSVAP